MLQPHAGQPAAVTGGGGAHQERALDRGERGDAKDARPAPAAAPLAAASAQPPGGAPSRRHARRVREPAVRPVRRAAASRALRPAAAPVRAPAAPATPGRQRRAPAAAAQLRRTGRNLFYLLLFSFFIALFTVQSENAISKLAKINCN